MGLFLEPTNCGESNFTNGLSADGKVVKIPLQSGDNLYYNGPNLAGTGIRTCDKMNEALQKLDAAILDLKTRVLALEQTLNML